MYCEVCGKADRVRKCLYFKLCWLCRRLWKHNNIPVYVGNFNKRAIITLLIELKELWTNGKNLNVTSAVMN